MAVKDKVLIVVRRVGGLFDGCVSVVFPDIHPDHRVNVEAGQLLRFYDVHTDLTTYTINI